MAVGGGKDSDEKVMLLRLGREGMRSGVFVGGIESIEYLGSHIEI